jgi:hypothetical protein
MTRLLCTLALVAAAAQAQAQETTLKAGDAAPPLSIAKWVKGEPVALGKGTPCVVVFWSAMSPESVAIMPHLSEIQEAHNGRIAIVAVTTEHEGNTLEAVGAMAAEKGPGMGFAVAWDDAGKTHVAYVGRRPIPCAFVVDGGGRIAWIGPPSALDLVVARAVSGTWDPAKGPAELEAIYRRAQEIFQMDRRMALQALAAFEKEHPALAPSIARPKFDLLVRAGKKEEAALLGAGLVAKAARFRDDNGLNSLAWFLVDPQTEIPDRLLDVAMDAATKAVEISRGEDGAILDTLARAHYWKGDIAKAIEIQTKAVEKAQAHPEMLGDLMEALDQYKAEAAAKTKTD